MNRKKKVVMSALVGTVLGTMCYYAYRTISRGGKMALQYAESVDKIPVNLDICLESDGVYSIRPLEKRALRVLQLTDLHIGGGYLSRHEDVQALRIIHRTILKAKPDLIVITGDFACSKLHQSLSRDNLKSLMIITNMLENIGIPYAFTFGNHDAEPQAKYEKKHLKEYLLALPNCLMVDLEDTKGITGDSNYMVKLRNYDKSLNTILYMLDSNDYLDHDKKKGYDYIHDDQVAWYENQVIRYRNEENRNIPSYIFMHIPVEEYDEAWEHLEKRMYDIKYFYGTKDEKVSCSSHKSKLFASVVKYKSTKGIFCGHDHVNDFSVEYEGVRLTYGQGIDCILYAKNLLEHKGGTVLNVNPDGTFAVKGIKIRRK